MPPSRIPSPARSQGARSTPRRHKPRASRSVGSPARSSSSVKLSALIQMDSFMLSPMPTRRSVLTDTTDIDVPIRKSWWKKLDENAREIMEVLNNKDPAEANDVIEEYIEVDVLSQEKKNYTMDIPESSDGESISSIVIPQRKLFTLKESTAQKYFAQMIGNPLYETQGDNDKTINVGRKNLFSQGTKRRTKPLFPSALLNVSANKTIANKTKELAAADPKAQVKSLFGNRPGAKRKNMFANFIVSDDSDDEIPEIQPKEFEFQKKSEQKRRQSVNSRASRESHITSPTSSITDIEIDDWRLLPSSTMVDHQLEDGLRTTPNKRARLGKLSEATETINTENNTTRNKTKQSNKSMHSKSKSKNVSRLQEKEDHLIDPRTNISGLDKQDNNKSNISREQNSKEQTIKNKDCSKSKNVSVMKIVSEVQCEVNVFEDKNAETIVKSYNKSSKALSKIDQVLQSDDDEDFSLVYENDDHIEGENEGNGTKISTEVESPKETSNVNKITAPEKAQNILDQENPQIDDEDVIQQLRNKSNNTSINNLRSTKDKQCRGSRFENEVDKLIDKGQNSLECNKISNSEKGKVREEQNNQENIDRFERNQECCSNYTDVRNKKHDDTIDDTNDQKVQDVENDQKSASEVDFNEDVMQEKQISTQEDTNTTDANISQEERSNHEEISEEEIEKELQHTYEDENEEEEIDDQDDEEQKSDRCELEKEQEIEQNATVSNDIIQTKGVTQNEKGNDEVEQNHVPRDEVDNKIIAHENKDICTHASPKNKKVNHTNDSTSNHEQKVDANVASPEVILHDKPSQIESFMLKGRNTSEWKTKSVIKNFTMRSSLAPARESTDFSNGSKNSSAEGSGWDSHRATRATLRQTFGKDFTPRKSLRTLVMEKAAKRQTNFTENNAEISRLPQANSTELPESTRFAVNQSHDEVPHNNSEKAHIVNNSGGAQNKNMSDRDVSHVIKSDNSKKIAETDHDLSSDNDTENSKIDKAQKMDTSNQEVLHNIDDFNGDPKSDESDQDLSSDNNPQNSKTDEVQEMDISNQELSHNIDFDEDPKNDESDHEHEINESDAGHETDRSDQGHESNESDNEQDIHEPDQAASHEMDNSDGAQNDDEFDNIQEMNDSNEGHESDHSVQEMTQDDEDEEMNSQEINHSSHEVSGKNDDADEESQMDVGQEMNESEIAQEMDESDEAQDEVDDERNINESDDEHDVNKSDDEQDVNESDDEQDVNESEDVHEMNYSNKDLSLNKDNEEVQEMEYGHEESRKTRQTTLEMYLQKIKRRNIERKKQLEEEIRNSLKTPARNMLNPFNVPAVPKLRRIKTQQMKTKDKPVKSSVVPLYMLPDEVLEDLKYKPPKRYRPTNASWITKRLYKFLETKLEPKYDYKARVRSEKLVETIYNFTKDIRRHETAPPAAVDALKHEMARLDIVKTHFEFYEFFHEYMPREVRVKVNPNVFNKIPLPKYGVFSDILR